MWCACWIVALGIDNGLENVIYKPLRTASSVPQRLCTILYTILLKRIKEGNMGFGDDLKAVCGKGKHWQHNALSRFVMKIVNVLPIIIVLYTNCNESDGSRSILQFARTREACKPLRGSKIIRRLLLIETSATTTSRR